MVKILSLFGAERLRGAGNRGRRSKPIILGSLLCAFLLLLTPVLAHAYSSVLSFGDSLSDDGGASSGYGVQGINEGGVTVGPFTNGSVWVTDLAGIMGVPLFDMAYGGAATGLSNPWAISNGYSQYYGTGLQSQVNTYLSNFNSQAAGFSQVPTTTLVTVLAGANDFLFQVNDPVTAANNVDTALTSLANSGFKNFLVPNLPDIANTPYFQQYLSTLPTADQATTYNEAEDWVQGFNTQLYSDLATLKSTYTGDSFFTLNTYGYLDQLEATMYAQYGASGVAQLFWLDGLHPSAYTHQLFADFAADTVPEPCTLLLLIVGLAALGACTLRKKATA